MYHLRTIPNPWADLVEPLDLAVPVPPWVTAFIQDKCSLNPSRGFGSKVLLKLGAVSPHAHKVRGYSGLWISLNPLRCPRITNGHLKPSRGWGAGRGVDNGPRTCLAYNRHPCVGVRGGNPSPRGYQPVPRVLWEGCVSGSERPHPQVQDCHLLRVGYVLEQGSGRVPEILLQPWLPLPLHWAPLPSSHDWLAIHQPSSSSPLI